MEFCRLLGLREHATYRLPYEIEWEYACRAGTTNAFGGTGKLDDMGWYSGNNTGILHAGGEKKPNAWGLFDMHGGVSEWCWDYWSTYKPSEKSDPVVGAYNFQRIVRGGNRTLPAKDCRSAARSGYPEDTKIANVGFRVVMEVDGDAITRPLVTFPSTNDRVGDK